LIGDPQEAAESLVHAAVEAGGRDNVTAVVVDVATIWHGLSSAERTHSYDDDEEQPATDPLAEWDEQTHGVTHPRPRPARAWPSPPTSPGTGSRSSPTVPWRCCPRPSAR